MECVLVVYKKHSPLLCSLNNKCRPVANTLSGVQTYTRGAMDNKHLNNTLDFSDSLKVLERFFALNLELSALRFENAILESDLALAKAFADIDLKYGK